MKVLIVAGTNLRYCPYANLYIDLFEEQDIAFDVLYANRNSIEENYDFSTVVYKWNNRCNKYIELMNYRRYILNYINKNSYTCVILLTTVIAVALSSSLKRMNIKYIVDIRDYTHEDLLPFYILEANSINNAECCIISSPRFREFLPKHDYIDVYNAPRYIASQTDGLRKNDGSTPIRIAYIGTIAYPNQCIKLMELVERDERFVFELYGNDINGNLIDTYIKQHALNRSRFNGPYEPKDKHEIIQSSDILFNAYGNDSPLLRYALSNKLTDAVMYYKPVLNSPETCMHATLSYCSYAIDFEDTLDLEQLYEWYNELDETEFNRTCNDIVARIQDVNERARTYVLDEIKALG